MSANSLKTRGEKSSNASSMVIRHAHRTSAGAEVDLVLEFPGSRGPWAIEIKHSLSASLSRDFRNALEDIKPERSFVVTAGSGRYLVAKDVEAIGLREMVFFLKEQ